MNHGLKVRYERWLFPLLRNWEEIKIRLERIPKQFEEPVREALATTHIKEVAKKYGLSEDDLQGLVDAIVYDADTPSAPFKAALIQEEIRRALEQNTAFDQMPQTRLLRTFLGHKKEGGNIKSFPYPPNTDDKNVSAVLAHLLEDIKAEIPFTSLPTPIQQIIMTERHPFYSTAARQPETWSMLYECNEAIIAKMLKKKNPFTTHQKAFLLASAAKLQEGKSLTRYESVFLNTLLDHPQPRSERKKWAEKVVIQPVFSRFPEHEQTLIKSLAQGERLAYAARNAGISIQTARSSIVRIQKTFSRTANSPSSFS